MEPQPDNRSIYAPGLSTEFVREMQEKLRTPEGTLILAYSSKGLFDFLAYRAILLQVVAGNTVFRLEKEANNLCFIHASPGEGTRIATVDLSTIKPVERLGLTFTWSGEGTAFYVGAADEPCIPVRAEGAKSTGRQLLVAQDGTVVEVGDTGVEVMGISFFAQGKPLLQSPAIAAWAEATKASEMILNFLLQDAADQMLKVLLANQVLSMLVTGYETYCKRRFLEMPGEGRSADFDSLANKFLPKREREANLVEIMKQEAKTLNISPVDLLVQSGRIDFQNYQNSKKAYSAAYGIRFGEMGVSNKVLEDIQKVIIYRHRIIHISPLIGLLNQPNLPVEPPVFSGYDVAYSALQSFDTFIQALHQQTLKVSSSPPEQKENLL